MQFTIQFKGCLVVGDTNDRNALHLGFAPGWADTRYPDGTHTDARPHDTPETRALAARLGYGDDARALGVYCCEHEIGHTFCAEAMGQPYSLTLWTQAHRPDHNYSMEEVQTLIVPEERIVKAWQRFVNTGEPRPGLAPLLAAGGDLAALHRLWERMIASAFGAAYWWRTGWDGGPSPWGPGPPPAGVRGD